MINKNFKPFAGSHSETTTTGSLLKQLDIELSEPMLFGLSEGLSFIFWNMKMMDFPFIAGRVKTLALSENLARNLHLSLNAQETMPIKKNWKLVHGSVDEGLMVDSELDCSHLELVHSGKAPVSEKTKAHDLSAAVINAISNNAREYLNPSVMNVSYQGILNASVEIIKWFKSSANLEYEFATTAMLIQDAETGGALFRNWYRDFLMETYVLTKHASIKQAHQEFVEIADMWSNVAVLIKNAGIKRNRSLVNQVSNILVELSEKEYHAMKLLEAVRL